MEKDVKYLRENQCYKVGKKIKPDKIVIHAVACSQPDRQKFVKSWNVYNPNGRQVCVHGFIDDKGVTQTLPFDVRAWGCGSGSKGSFNDSALHFELCESGQYVNGKLTNYNPEEHKKYFFSTYNNAVEYIAELCEKYAIKVDKIYSHKEAHALGYASNHGDPDHVWKHHKVTMDTFRTDVAKKIASNNANTDKCSSIEINQIKISLNGDIKVIDAINVEGFNYIKLRDLECNKVSVGYDSKNNIPLITIK